MILVLVLLALVTMVATHVLLQRRLARECRELLAREEARRVAADELEEARCKVLYKQQKESVAIVGRSDRAVRKLSDEVRKLVGDIEVTHRSIEDFFANERVKRYLGQADG